MTFSSTFRHHVRDSALWPLLSRSRDCFRRMKVGSACLLIREADLLRFKCNICGRTNATRRSRLKREIPSCVYCNSNVRWRSIIQALSLGLFGSGMSLPDFEETPALVGVGMSDWAGYAVPLSNKLNYYNSYYHQEPFLDICKPPTPELKDHFDFIISSDVLEHVAPPISCAFSNIFHLLKPGGLLVLSVPFMKDVPTQEHFPDLNEFEIQQVDGKWTLINQREDGSESVYHNLVFHGGPGLTVEMRLFGLQDLLARLTDAGFVDVKVLDSPFPDMGIIWNPHDPDEDHYSSRILGLDAPPIIARRPISIY